MSANSDTLKIINHSIFLAQELLSHYDDFYPFGWKIDNDGRLLPIALGPQETAINHSDMLIEEFKLYVQKQLDQKSIRAYGFAYDLKTEKDGRSTKSDVLCVNVCHSHDNKIPAYYFPYVIELDGTVRFKEVDVK